MSKNISAPSHINPFIAERLKQRAQKLKKSHSIFWMPQADADSLLEKLDESSLEYVERLRKLQHGVSNFVKIITGKEIPVKFSSGQQSYTDGKQVILSADVDPGKIDTLSGTAMHEASHCLLSNQSLKFLKDFFGTGGALSLSDTFFDELERKHMPISSDTTRLKITRDELKQDIVTVMNVLEDRRIDLWMYENAPGYRPYYEAMYGEYWHSEVIDEALKNPASQDQSVEAYLMDVINMTNKNVNFDGMPGLREIKKIASLKKETCEARGDVDHNWISYRYTVKDGNLDKMPKLFQDAFRIVETIYRNSTSKKMAEKPQFGDPNDMSSGMGNDLPNYDPLTKEMIDAIRDAIKKQQDFLSGKIDKKDIGPQTAALLEQLESTNARVVEVNGDDIDKSVKAQVAVYRNLNKKIVTGPLFPFGRGNNKNPMMIEAIKKGVMLGQMLANKIAPMQDERPVMYNHQEHGRIDKRRLAALGFSAEDVFAFSMIERAKPANLWMDIDFSGSMSGEKSRNAMALAIAVAFAAEKTRTLNTTIAIRAGTGNYASVAIIYDSRKNKFGKIREIVPYLWTSGGTPESLCFEAVKDEMMNMFKGERKYFINFSDGEPSYGFAYKGKSYHYAGEQAARHTRSLMRDFEAAGIHIMSYFIGEDVDKRLFKAMYGANAVFIAPQNITDISRTLNKLLISKEY